MRATLLALRLGRWGIIGFALLGFVSTLVRVLAFYQIAGHTTAERGAFGATMNALAPQFTVILPGPIRPDTVAGYAEYGGFGPLTILFAVWALVSATGAARGDEERGIVETMLATGLSRVGAVASRMVAFAIGIVIASTAAAAGFAIGVQAGGESFSTRALAEEAVLLAALGFSCYAICLLVAQLSAAHMATAVAGIVLLTLFLDNTLSRTFTSLASWRWLSPFRYFDLNRPLSSGGAFELGPVLVLLGISVVAGAAAATAFAARDLGSPLVRAPARSHAPTYDVSRAPWWRVAILRGLYDRRAGLAAWCIGMALLAVIYVSLTKTILQPLLSLRALAPYFGAFVKGNLYPSFLGFTWFNVAQLLFAAFAIAQVARWSAEDTDGRLEIVLSQPYSRVAVLLERLAVLAVGALLVAAVSGAAIFYASRSNGIELNSARLAAASLMLVPFALVFGAAGALLASWNPRAAVGLLGAIAFASYLDAEVGALLTAPAWLLDLSSFRLFGRPLLDGANWRNLSIMLLVVIVSAGSSILAMQRRDVGS